MNSLKVRRAPLALAVGFALFVMAAPAQAGNAWAEAGLGVASVATSILYAPAKIIYATGGVVTTGLAWVFSAGTAPLTPIIDASVRGDYVVTPDNLRGRERLEFIGRPPQYRRLASDDSVGSERLSGDDGF